MIHLMDQLVYEPLVEGKEMPKLRPMNALPTNPLDLQWQLDNDNVMWNKNKKQRLRGLWVEALLELFSRVDCLPGDLDLYAAAMKYQEGEKEVFKESQLLRWQVFKNWMKHSYFKGVMTRE